MRTVSNDVAVQLKWRGAPGHPQALPTEAGGAKFRCSGGAASQPCRFFGTKVTYFLDGRGSDGYSRAGVGAGFGGCSGGE